MSREYFFKVYNKLLKYKSYIVLGIIFIFLVYCAYEYSKYFYILRDLDRLKKVILSYGRYSILAFIMLQVIQVIAFFIPGEIVQIAGGYIYGTLVGSLLSIIGITMGSIAGYGISNYYGKPLISKIISKRDMKFFQRILNMGSINYIVFLLYLIPGIPKDVLSYICGVSSISFRNFFVYSTLGRLPGIFISAYFGAKIDSNNTSILIIIAISMTILFILGVFKGEKIIKVIVRDVQTENDK
ncbi:TVP38/TMEM64 family protein [Clostridium sp. DJ247]|nr:TVP38/TMEM64 family protein [Clostridium sp. DJ247]MBC2579939.1 TVP38/TMEM64 family protein [Clostridium sp. DJ247]